MKLICKSHISTLKAYTLVELTVAASIIGAGLLSIAALTNLSEEVDNVHQPKRRVIAIMEARAKLWQLRLPIGSVNNFVFADPALPDPTQPVANSQLVSAVLAVPIPLAGLGAGANITHSRLTQQARIDAVDLPTITSIQSN
jgi:type II secretory pathway pseudopilin PulG